MSEQDPLEQDPLAEKIKQGEIVQFLSERVQQQRQEVEYQNLKSFNLRLRTTPGRSEQACGCYRNWIIKLIPQDSDWTVAYCTPGGEIFIDGKTYRTAELALAAAEDLVDRNIAGFALLEFLFELYDNRKISTEQYSQLTSSLIEDCL